MKSWRKVASEVAEVLAAMEGLRERMGRLEVVCDEIAAIARDAQPSGALFGARPGTHRVKVSSPHSLQPHDGTNAVCAAQDEDLGLTPTFSVPAYGPEDSSAGTQTY